MGKADILSRKSEAFSLQIPLGLNDATKRPVGISLFRHKLLEGIAGQTALSYSYIENIREIFTY